MPYFKKNNIDIKWSSSDQAYISYFVSRHVNDFTTNFTALYYITNIGLAYIKCKHFVLYS